MLREDPATSGDLAFIAAHLRPSDREELRAYGYETPMHALHDCLKSPGRTNVLRESEGSPVCIYGLHRTAHEFSAPWMLGTTLILQHRKDFWAHSVRVIEEFQREGKPLYNVTHSENRTAIAWLRRLGFVIHYDRPVELRTGAIFLPFEKFTHVRTH